MIITNEGIVTVYQYFSWYNAKKKNNNNNNNNNNKKKKNVWVIILSLVIEIQKKQNDTESWIHLVIVLCFKKKII